MERLTGVTKHARERARQRLGRDLTRHEWNRVLLDIVEGRTTILFIQEDGKEVRLATIGDMPLKLLWAPVSATIITIFPDEAAFSRAASGARCAKVKASLNGGGYYRQGKLKRARTIWQDRDR